MWTFKQNTLLKERYNYEEVDVSSYWMTLRERENTGT